MQVTHQEDHINHVMITNEKPIEFGISNSAEFFSILSSTLYKDQKLAVVRETLCNAWDIHIEGGITDVPVEVTIDDEKIIILDHGKGIHKDDMGLIYGTYGNSTKKNDGTQTGGFGLGCKSPFAYTDHFDVESSHDGKRTIYNLSKSSGQVMGKPTINPIVTVPTQESGLKVTIPIKANDQQRFIQLFTRIAQNGDMNILINGEKPEDPLNMDMSKGFIITKRQDLSDKASVISIRYGNVIYPVDHNDNYRESYQQILNHLSRISRGHGHYKIIFQAKPHSIAVTPSREELSMQVHTVQALKEIFDNFVNEIKNNFDVEANEQIKEVIVKAVERKDINALLSNSNELPYSEDEKAKRRIFGNRHGYTHKEDDNVNMTAWPEQVKHWLMTGYPDFGNFHKIDMNLRLSEMVRQKVGDVQLIKSYIDALKLAENSAYKKSHWVSHDTVKHEYNWLGRVILAPLMVKIQQAGFNYKNLYVYEPKNNWGTIERDDQRSDFPLLAPADEARSKNLLDSIGYLKKIIVFTSARSKLLKRVENSKEFRNLIGSSINSSDHGSCWLYYQISKKTGELDTMKDIFTKAGYHIVDLVDVQPWEAGYRDPALPKVKAPPKPKGIPNFFNVIWDHKVQKERSHVNIKLPTQTMEPLRVEKPKAVTSYGVSGSERYHPKFHDQETTKLIANMFGKDIGVCLLQKSYLKWIEAGVPDIYDYVLDDVIAYMKQSKTIAEYHSNNLERIRRKLGMDLDEVSLVSLIWRHPILKNKYGIKDNRTKEDRDYETLFKWYEQYGNDKAQKAALEVKEQFSNIPLNTRLMEMVKYAKGSTWIRSLNITWFGKQLDEAITDTAKTEELIEFMQDLLNRA